MIYRNVETEPAQVVRRCKVHGLVCSDGAVDEVICPGGHTLRAPVRRRGQPESSIDELPWTVETVRGTRLADEVPAALPIREERVMPSSPPGPRPAATPTPPLEPARPPRKYFYGTPKVLDSRSFRDGTGRRLYLRLQNHTQKGWYRVYIVWGTNPSRSEPGCRDGGGNLAVFKPGETAEADARKAFKAAIKQVESQGWKMKYPIGSGRPSTFRIIEIPPANGARTSRRKK